MDAALNQAVIKGSESVFESMLGWDVKGKEPVEMPINASSSETSVVISIVGNVSGAITFKCTKAFAKAIASTMVGAEVEDGSDDMKDAVGELLNMVVGTAKATYSSDDAFKISLPTTIIGGDYTVHIKANSSDTTSLIDFACDKGAFSIEVYLK